ncbi:MAG: OmpA family protein [Woeseiaceae bacterium]
MKVFLRTMVLIGAMTIGANAVMADDGDKYIYLLGSQLVPDTAFDQDDGWGAQLGLGIQVNRWWNMEGYIGANRADASREFSNESVGADMQLVFSRSKFQPYVFGGIAFQDTELTGRGKSSSTALQTGLGVRALVFGDSNAALRAEYRYSNYDSHGLTLDDQFYTIGFQVPFGKKAAMPVVVAPKPVGDADGDGVNDDRDQCPNTPAGVSVDARGCALDSDGDGVADHMDQCPGTVRGAKVDAKGCELDGDNDGVVDRLDRCPNSAPGAQVDINGCEIKEEIDLPGVNFESNSDRLLPGAESVLNDAAATLRKNPEIKVEVAGHTDSDGSAEHNESLSARRATTVRDFLAGRGVELARMTVRGYGEGQPIADNATSAGKATNRRVVLRITER